VRLCREQEYNPKSKQRHRFREQLKAKRREVRVSGL
jgi:hypothetical protein